MDETKSAKALDKAVYYEDAGAWHNVINEIKKRYKINAVGDGFDRKVIKHLNDLLDIFESGSMP